MVVWLRFSMKSHRSIVNQVVYNKAFNILASSGVEKTIRIWSQFNQLPFPNSKIEETKSRNTENTEGDSSDISKRQQYIRQILARGEAEVVEEVDEDDDIIAFFDALREATPSGSSIIRQVNQDESRPIGSTIQMGDVNSDDSDLEEAFESSSSSTSSGILEPLTIEESNRISELEAFDIARHRHLQRQRISNSLGGAMPNTSLHSPVITSSSSDSDEEEINERRKRSRMANASRKRKKI